MMMPAVACTMHLQSPFSQTPCESLSDRLLSGVSFQRAAFCTLSLPQGAQGPGIDLHLNGAVPKSSKKLLLGRSMPLFFWEFGPDFAVFFSFIFSISGKLPPTDHFLLIACCSLEITCPDEEAHVMRTGSEGRKSVGFPAWP